ncbi:flagellar type III secretion system protein FlhB [Ramlibacter sp. H39-3-26]|uniref:flagellar type III secretion system protein FlhB n=1 Tax=Curvibacter soli TaxID=3031331 RepID=UPI0023DA1223|nr:flagellar type III secretion system protein FlhB [Ramlibacter sp. H39-3-26]MDF1484227.1 flagellar type III secretion system protein FlhB [Ramlibacter sp. H39-3-26]
MADESSSGDKTENASAQKLRKSREQGQVPRSRDLATAVGIVLCLKAIVLLTPSWLEDFRALFMHDFAPLSGEGALDNLQSTMLTQAIALTAKMVAPLAIVPLAIVLSSLFPGGWVLSAHNLMPRFGKLNPLSYFTRMFEPRHAIEFITTLLKASTLLAVLYYVCRGSIGDFMAIQQRPLDEALRAGAGLMLDAVLALCTVFVAFALIDVPVQRFIFLRNQRMTKREVKEEHKSNEGSPEVRQRIRKLQMQMARRSVRKTVPTADVVVVNPEHYAVALKYDDKRAEAPFVVAKGVDEMALYIRTVAREHAVEVLEFAPLARAIYNTSQVYQQIPAPLYKAVAQVLGYVLQLKAFQSGRRPSRPAPPRDLAVPENLT